MDSGSLAARSPLRHADLDGRCDGGVSEDDSDYRGSCSRPNDDDHASDDDGHLSLGASRPDAVLAHQHRSRYRTAVVDPQILVRPRGCAGNNDKKQTKPRKIKKYARGTRKDCPHRRYDCCDLHPFWAKRYRGYPYFWKDGKGHRAQVSPACQDRKSTRLNSSHLGISYAVFCLKKKKKNIQKTDIPARKYRMKITLKQHSKEKMYFLQRK